MDHLRRLRAPADGTDLDRWQVAARARLTGLLAIPQQRGSTRLTVAGYGPRPQVREASFAAHGITVPCCLVTPATTRAGGASPAGGAAVVAIAGHGRGIDALIDPDDAYHRGLALRLAAAGFVVLCPELRSFGRRRTADAVALGPAESSCQVDGTIGLLTGRPVLGDRVADTMGAVSALAGLPGIDPKRIAVVGGSGGGAVALLTAALDERVAAAVVATYFSSFAASMCSTPHCICNSVPDLLTWFEMVDLAALTVPRPLIIEAGEHDPIFPVTATRASHAELVELCSGAGAGPPALIVTDRGHEFDAEAAIERLMAAIGPIPYPS